MIAGMFPNLTFIFSNLTKSVQFLITFHVSAWIVFLNLDFKIQSDKIAL